MITERESLGRELQRILDAKTNPWGITVQSVEIRDRTDSAGAGRRDCHARRRRNVNAKARIILGQAENGKNRGENSNRLPRFIQQKPRCAALARDEHVV